MAVDIGHRTLSITSEFDDCIDPAAATHGGEPSRPRSALPELIADAYRRAAAPLRRKLLEGLRRPAGSLALAAVVSGRSVRSSFKGSRCEGHDGPISLRSRPDSAATLPHPYLENPGEW
jgi:hypothetical protein